MILTIAQVIVTIFALWCVIGIVGMIFEGTVPSSEEMGEGRFW
jgi:hypothetical protein